MRPLPSARHDAALRVPTAYVRVATVTFTRGGRQQTLVPTGGSVTQDGRTSQRWSAALTFTLAPGEDPPTVPHDLLTPFGTRVAVDLGIQLADGTVSTVAYGRFLLASSAAGLSPSARTVSTTLADLSAGIVDHRFERPFTVAAGTDLADVVRQVAADRDPTVDVGALTPTGATLARQATFGLDVETDPWLELQDVVRTRGFRLWFDRDGQIRLDQPPAQLTSLRDVDPGEAGLSFDARPANVVVARGEPADGSPPVFGLWEDDDPASPTFAGGPYGRVTRFYASPLLASDGQAQQAAASIGRQIRSGGAAWIVARPYDPTWDPDDGVRVPLPSGQLVQLAVEEATVDLAGTTVMAAHTDVGGGP